VVYAENLREKLHAEWWEGIMKCERVNQNIIPLFCATVFCIIFLCASVTGWQIETVDSNNQGTYQGGVTLAIGSLGEPHVVFSPYTDPTIKYATKESGTWQSFLITTVYPMPQPSLEIGTDNIPRVVYFDPVERAIKLIRNESGKWISEKIDNSYYDGYMLSPHDFALDSNNQAHVVYAGNNDFSLKYAWFDVGENKWKHETIDSNVGTSISISVDSSNHPHVAYINKDRNSLKYAYYNGQNWAIETLYDGNTAYSVGGDCSIDVDNENRPHIAFSKTGWNELNYAYFNGSEWVITRIPNQYGGDLSIDVDGNGVPHIAFTDHGNGTNAELKYTWFDGQTWRVQVVDTEGDTGHACELKLNSEGTAFIIYYDDTPIVPYRLLLAVNRPPVLNIIGSRTVAPGSTLLLNIEGRDPDLDTLTYTAENLPTGSTFDIVTRTFTWTNAVIGTYQVTFTVDDGTFTDSETITIKVVDPYQWNPIGPDGKQVRSLAISPGYVTDGTISGGTLEGN